MRAFAKRTALRGMCTLVVVLCFSGGFAFSENLPDPTRPSGTGMRDPEAAGPVSGPVLQSVLISPGRRVAIINGQSVKLGEKVGEARVVKIAETEVTLAQGEKRQVLRLFPHVDKRITQTSSRPQIEVRR